MEFKGNSIVLNQTTISSHIIQFLNNTEVYFDNNNYNNYLYFSFIMIYMVLIAVMGY